MYLLEGITRIITEGSSTSSTAHGILNGPLSPVLVLWIGALVLHLLDSLLQPQDEGVAEATALTLGLGFLVHARAKSGEVAHLGIASFDLPFEALEGRWLLAFILLVGVWAASLTSLNHPTRGRAGRLAATGGALLFILAGDWSTALLAWMVTDVALANSLAGREDLKWTLALSLGGSVALGVALGLWQRSFPLLSPYVAPLLAIGATLRVLPWPLPSWLPAATRDERPTTRVVTYAIPTILGSYLWAMLAGYGILGPHEGPATAALTLGAMALVIGAVEAWGGQTPEQTVRAAATYGGAILILGAGLKLSAAYLTTAGAYATLSVVTLILSWTFCHHLHLNEASSWWRAAPSVVVMLSLAGMPLTVGFAVRAEIYEELFAGKRWLILLAVMTAESLMLAALLRLLLELESDVQAPEKDWRYELGYGAGAICAIALMSIGLPSRALGLPGWGQLLSSPTLPVWAALTLPIAGAVAIYRSPWMATVHLPHLSTDAIYRAVEAPLGRLRSLIWGVTLVVEGQGYIAWVVLVCLVVLIFVLSH